MSTTYRWILPALSITTVWSSQAEAIGVSLSCPKTVQVGQPFRVTVTLSNKDCHKAIAVARMMRGLAGNSGGALHLRGPFNTTFDPPKVVPPAVCGTVFQPARISLLLTVIASTPADLANTMALAYAEVLNKSGGVSGGNTCFAQVLR